jgi:23S rRNA (uracil1939-C5)-methyltransferase
MRGHMREYTVRIDKMAFGGSGIGRVDGKICFVPFTATGDTARIRIDSEKKSYCEGGLLEILEPSPLRVDPPCPVFGKCGGCDWQHLEYSAQLRAKQEIFCEILWRTGRVDAERILPIVASPGQYGYRARVQLKMRYVRGEIHLGFFRAGSHYVVDIPQECAISCSAINRSLGEVRVLLGEISEPDKIPQIDIATGDQGDILLVFHYIGENRDQIMAFLNKNRHGLSLADGVFLQSGRKNTIETVFGRENISYTIHDTVSAGLPEMSLTTSRGGFSQVNYRQNNALIDIVLQWTQPGGHDNVLDLYCGNGNFSLPIARHVAQVVGFEEFEQSIRDADRNGLSNKMPNARFECIDSVEGMKRLAADGECFDIILLDPPRTGAAEAVKVIPALKPKKILYISCDPPTLARDVAYLKKLRYEVTRSRPVDMFPQTYHIESVTLLENVGG